MKISILIFMFLVNISYVHAQFAKVTEPELTKEQQWLFDQTSKQMMATGDNSSTRMFLDNYRKLLSSGIFCKKASSQTTIHLEGERLNEHHTLLEWDVFEETGEGLYVVERRFNDPHGDFDSIGIIENRQGNAVLQSYRFADNNDHPGISWYRLRRINLKDDIQKLVKVDGYVNEVKVFPNPAKSSDISIELFRFKHDAKNAIIIQDSRGSIVHYSEQLFVNDQKIYRLKNLGLAPGAYHIKISNRYNSGSTTFVVQ